MSDEPTFEQLKTRVEELEAQRSKAVWLDTAAKVGGIVSPLILLLVGFLLQQPIRDAEASMKQAQTDFSQSMDQKRLQLDVANAKVEQVKIIASFLDALAGTDERKKVIAIQALLIALPDEGPQLVRQISGDAGGAGPKGGGVAGGPQGGGAVAQAAANALDTRRRTLIDGLYSSDKATRLASFGDLQRGFGSDSGVLPALLDVAPRRLDNLSGTINAVVFLKVYTGDRPPPETVAQIRAFALSARGNGPQTAGHVAELLKRWD